MGAVPASSLLADGDADAGIHSCANHIDSVEADGYKRVPVQSFPPLLPHRPGPLPEGPRHADDFGVDALREPRNGLGLVSELRLQGDLLPVEDPEALRRFRVDEGVESPVSIRDWAQPGIRHRIPSRERLLRELEVDKEEASF